ncbi:hypothetical protein HMY34_16370 [Thiothrix subterranea]|uniref:caspase family protein n=1 Tax=Thiothrix subterranea TaxID=2735563 RepID=UPI00192C54B3|nr:caspase family protein [Thiothrix subterranea]QQZ30209.1 hypothetical protein HMY34_16370 [Thiothrix subterranea]
MSRRIALIVGVSQYESRTGLHSLSAPVNDAQRVYKVLSEYGDFDMLYPLPLADGEVGSSGKVYAHDLQAKLCEVLSPSTDEEVDLAVFYFSGHGVSERGQVVYLSTSDERLAIAIPWLAELVKTSAVKNVCIWLDCCHSGEVLKFTDLGERGFCVVAASHAEGEALARADGNSLLTDILCKALTPSADCQEIQVKHFINELEQQRHNLPQQVLCRWSDTPFTLTQLNGEVVRESSSLRKPARGWVRHSTDESIAAGQISVLSVLETFFALGLYGWLAFHFEHQWWLLISAVAAPIILLRSPESKALGVKWFRSYWEKRDKKWSDLSTTKKMFIIAVPITIGLLTWWLAVLWLPGHEYSELFWRAFALGVGASTGAVAVDIVFMDINTGKFTGAGAGVLMLVLVGAMAFAFASADFFAAWVMAFVIAVFAVEFGIWLRSLFIRIVATGLRPVAGLRHLANNWRETVAVVDFTHLPELLPGATEVDADNLTIRGYFSQIHSHKDEDRWINVLFFPPVLYLPAMMWRWSLKATLWLWFPLALLLRSPFEEKSLGASPYTQINPFPTH